MIVARGGEVARGRCRRQAGYPDREQLDRPGLQSDRLASPAQARRQAAQGPQHHGQEPRPQNRLSGQVE